MNALRLVYKDLPNEIPMPDEFRHRPVEVIIMQLEERHEPGRWPVGFFEETAGSFANTPLVREPQGDYEVRKELQ